MVNRIRTGGREYSHVYIRRRIILVTEPILATVPVSRQHFDRLEGGLLGIITGIA